MSTFYMHNITQTQTKKPKKKPCDITETALCVNGTTDTGDADNDGVQSDYSALATSFASVTGLPADWFNNTDPCANGGWTGVTCDTVTTSVTTSTLVVKIELPNAGLAGYNLYIFPFSCFFCLFYCFFLSLSLKKIN